MQRFAYKAYAATGSMVEGQLEAADRAAAAEQLRQQRCVPIVIQQLDRQRGRKGRGLPFWARRVTPKDVALATRQLASLLAADMTLDDALDLLEEQLERTRLGEIIAAMRTEIRAGHTVSAAMAAHDEVFSPLHVNLIRAGESDGKLDMAFRRLAEQLEASQAIRAKIQAAAFYPAILLAMSILSIYVLVTVVLPQFLPLLENSHVEPSWSMRLLIDGSAFLERNTVLLLLIALALLIGLRLAMVRPAVRVAVDRLLLQLPLLRLQLITIEAARFARTLGCLIIGGTRMNEALGIAADAVGNHHLRAALLKTKSEVEAGRPLGTSLRNQAMFPKVVCQLITAGERSGKLADMLLRAANLLEAETERRLDQMMALLVPMLTIVSGGIVAGVLSVVLTAVLSVYETAL